MRSLQDIATYLRRALAPTFPSLLWFAALSTAFAVAWAWFLSQPFGIPFSRGRLIAYLAMAAIGFTLGVTRVPIHVVALAALAGLLLGFAWAAAHSSDVFRGSFDFVVAFEKMGTGTEFERQVAPMGESIAFERTTVLRFGSARVQARLSA